VERNSSGVLVGLAIYPRRWRKRPADDVKEVAGQSSERNRLRNIERLWEKKDSKRGGGVVRDCQGSYN